MFSRGLRRYFSWGPTSPGGQRHELIAAIRVPKEHILVFGHGPHYSSVSPLDLLFSLK